MLTFLRKIRKSLIESGSTRKYLLYAIGEIILVVLGILIALQINIWNEARKDTKAENSALVNLKIEFDENQERLDFLIENRKTAEEQCRTYLEFITDENVSVSDKAKATLPSQFSGVWGTTNSVLNSLLSTGGIDRIESDSLRFLLTNWNSWLENYNKQESRFIDRLDEWKKYMNTIVHKSIVRKGNYEEGWPGNYYPNNVDLIAEKQMSVLVKDPRHYNHIAEILDFLYLNLIDATTMTNQYHHVSSLIIKELNERGTVVSLED